MSQSLRIDPLPRMKERIIFSDVQFDLFLKPFNLLGCSLSDHTFDRSKRSTDLKAKPAKIERSGRCSEKAIVGQTRSEGMTSEPTDGDLLCVCTAEERSTMRHASHLTRIAQDLVIENRQKCLSEYHCPDNGAGGLSKEGYKPGTRPMSVRAPGT